MCFCSAQCINQSELFDFDTVGYKNIDVPHCHMNPHQRSPMVQHHNFYLELMLLWLCGDVSTANHRIGVVKQNAGLESKS